jgi:hypothetical protein
MKKKKYLLTIIGLAIYIAGFSQQDNRPSWYNGVPVSKYYNYYFGVGEDENVSKAREIAVNVVKGQIADEICAEYEIDKNSTTSFNNVQDGDTVKTHVKYEFVGTIKQTGQKVKVKGIREVETYTEGNQYYVLYRVPKKDVYIPPKYEDLYITDNSHKWKSAIFPGWGQMTVGKKKQGALFLISAGFLVAGIATSQTMYSINHNNYTSSLRKGDITNADIYKTNRDTWGTVRNISIVGFAGVYVFNLINALSTKGNKIYSFNTKRMRIYPAASSNYIGMGICLKLN